MKKIFLTLIIVFIFIPTVKADLSSKQSENLATFTINFINEGNKRTDSKGFPLFAYMQGQARIDGYQSKLYKVYKDYVGKNVVNGYKWTFDCSSFASFIYYKTFNLILTNNTTSKIDEYSGLKIRRETANPYEVQSFFDDASRKEHFYFVKSNITVKNINYSELKKGDLIIIKGSHIMIYIGNGNIAHASRKAITTTNLGLEIANLNDIYPEKKVYIIRLKDGIISPTSECSKSIYFPDTKEMVTLIKDKVEPVQPIQSDSPTIKYNLSTTEWTKSLELNIDFEDAIGLKSYSINGKEYQINGKLYSLFQNIKENGNYLIEVKNTNNQTKSETITIKNIDNNAPIIEDIQLVEYENYKQLVVKAVDSESGLNSNSYSFDSGKTWTYNTYNIKETKDYEIFVRDNLGNTAKKTYYMKSVEKANPKIGNVIFGAENNNKKKVIISTVECYNCKIAITNEFKIPENKEILNNNEYVTYLEEGKYYIWLEYNGKIVDNKMFVVNFDRKSNFELYGIIILVLVPLAILAVIYFKKHGNNQI